MAGDKHRDPDYKLDELEATAICGNDITSSCLYVSALTILQAGKWAPLALVIVAAVLFLYRKIYAEVVGALPLNGGAYNALLNTTSKKVATLAACLTLLSYMATAVISASEAMLYVRRNEHTNFIKVAIVYADKKEIPARLEDDLKFLGEAYPDIHIEYVEVEGQFGPELIENLSQLWKIPANFMFIGSPGDHFPYRLEELGGVRLII